MTDAKLIETVGTCEFARRMGIDAAHASQWKKRGIPFARRMDALDAMGEHIADAEKFMRGVGRK